MKILVLSFWIGLLGIQNIYAQELSKEERSDIINIVYDYFYKSPIAQRNANKNIGRSERFILILKVNNECRISEVTLFADNKNIDSGFAIINTLSIGEFQNWKSKTVKNKTILLPIVVINNGQEYKESLEFIANFQKLRQTSEMVIIPGIEFKWPIRRNEY